MPTEWQAKITIDQGIPANKVKIVREAVNPEIYETKTSPLSNDVFTENNNLDKIDINNKINLIDKILWINLQ